MTQPTPLVLRVTPPNDPAADDPGPTTRDPRPSGLQATIAAATALAGLVVVLRPQSQVARTINDVMPSIGISLPVLVTAAGTIIAALSHPPRIGSR